VKEYTIKPIILSNLLPDWGRTTWIFEVLLWRGRTGRTIYTIIFALEKFAGESIYYSAIAAEFICYPAIKEHHG
jgi:hypothetical protein